jgi:hypothetical protein
MAVGTANAWGLWRLDDGSGLGWSRSRGRQLRRPPRAPLTGVTMFVERHQRGTNAASRCNHHDICGGRKGKARKLTPSLLSAWVPADRWGTWAFGDDGYEEVWHAATGPANQEAVAMPCACPTRIWFAHFLGFRQHMQVGLYHTGPYHAADSHTKHDYKAPTTRTLNIALLENTHPRCSLQLLLASTLTRLLSDPPGTPACSPDRRSAKRARTHRRPSDAAAACA